MGTFFELSVQQITKLGNRKRISRLPELPQEQLDSIHPGETIHGAGYTRAAGMKEAHDLTLGVAKGMALVGWKFSSTGVVGKLVKDTFKLDIMNR
jgi:hypothetical protein